MSKSSIAIVIGTRPEAIKLAPLIKEFKSCKKFLTKVILTGQHKEMVDQVLNIFEIKDDINLSLMRKSQSLTYITCSALEGLENVFRNIKPKLVIVQGDTSTAFSAALAAFYLKIPVGHVEAGLRSNDIYDPYPEEINRRLISQITSLHFAPTKKAYQNLINSNVSGKIFITGNTVIDALLLTAKKTNKTILENIDCDKNRIIFSTIHRRENWGKNIEKIGKILKDILEKYSDTVLLLPMHRNRAIREPLQKILTNHPRAFLVEPLNYVDCVSALKFCYILVTDSGGLQEEAPSLGKPVLVLRKTTERPEAIESGNSVLVGVDKKRILNEVDKLLTDRNYYQKMARAINPFGDGKASKRILKECINFLD